MKWLSRFFRMLPLVALMLPVPAHGELVLSFFGWSGISTSLHFEGSKTAYQQPSLETSRDGHLQNPGYGFGASVWFGRDFFFGMFGIGLDAVPSLDVDVGDANMRAELATIWLLLRLPPKGFSFLGGRLVPYAGMGMCGFPLDGDVAFFAGTKEDYSLSDSKGLAGKWGLEWFIAGPLAVFLEYRYMRCGSSFDRVDDTRWFWYYFIPIPVTFGEHVEANLRLTQLCLGMALHL